MNLSTTMGIELTYIPNILQMIADDFENGVDLAEDMEDTFLYAKRREFQKALRNKGFLQNFVRVGEDPGVVEVPTKPFKKLESLLKVAATATKTAKEVGMSPKLPYQTGGGAHIHMGMKDSPQSPRHEQRANALKKLVAEYPVMSWAFVDLSDDINATPPTLPIMDWDEPFDKDHALNFNGHYNTAELRFFEMGDRHQLRRNILFADALFRKAEEMVAAEGDITFTLPTELSLKRMTKKEALKQWDDLVKLLGLNARTFAPQRVHLGKRMDAMKRKEVGV